MNLTMPQDLRELQRRLIADLGGPPTALDPAGRHPAPPPAGWPPPATDGDARRATLAAMLACEAAGQTLTPGDTGDEILSRVLRDRSLLPGAATGPGAVVAALSTYRPGTAGVAVSDGGRATGVFELLHRAGAALTEALVVVPDATGTCLLAVSAGDPGVSVERHTVADPARELLRIRMTDVPVTPDRVRPLPPAALDDLIAMGRLFTCADLLGTMQWALDRSVEHAARRVQFGQPIGAHQGVSHQCADMFAAVELARSLVYAAAARCDARGNPDADLSRLALVLCAASAAEVVAGALHLHGAAGLCTSSALPLALRRCQVSSQLWGEHGELVRTVVEQMTKDHRDEDNHG